MLKKELLKIKIETKIKISDIIINSDKMSLLKTDIRKIKGEKILVVGIYILKNNTAEEPSCEIKKRIIKARNIQQKRYTGLGIMTNSELSSKYISKYCKINRESEQLLKCAFERLGLSARAYNKILKVARTAADLEGSENIETEHIAEAIQYRSLDRKYWR